MSKIKAICQNEACDQFGVVQEVESSVKACPFCGRDDTWEIQKPKPILPWKWLLGVLVFAAIIVFFAWPCEHTIKLGEPHNRTIIVGDTDTLRASTNGGDSVVWTVAIGDSLVNAVAINDSMCVVKALKEGQQAVVVASLLGCSDVKDSCVYVIKPLEIIPSDTVAVIKDSIPDGNPKDKVSVTTGEDGNDIIDHSVGNTGMATIDLGYATYTGPFKVVNGKKVPHGLGGELKFKRSYEIDLKKASGEKVQVDSGDRMRNCKFDNGRLVQGLIVFSNGEQRWITIGS